MEKQEEKQELKKASELEKMDIKEIEIKIEELRLLSRENQKEMYEYLEYLRMTNRYKENALYKKSSFWEYLEDRFTIREATYRGNVRAFTKFPQDAKKFGVGLISKIDKVCGSIKIGDVLSEIHKEINEHKKPISRKKITNIILKHKLSTKTKEKSPNWKMLYENEKAAHERTKEDLKTLMNENKELKEQNEKLKVTAQMTHDIRKIVNSNSKMQRVATV